MKIIDEIALNKMVGNNSDLLADVAIMFAHSLPEIKARLRVGIENQDARIVEDAAHQLRSRISYFGANGPKEIAGQMELMARRNELSQLTQLNQSLADSLELLLDELRQLTNLALELEDE